VTRAFPPGLRMVSHRNLIFGSGILKQTSVRISRFLERIFTKHDPFRLALTSLVVVVNEPKSNSSAD
jgi:hypothetical protein